MKSKLSPYVSPVFKTPDTARRAPFFLAHNSFSSPLQGAITKRMKAIADIANMDFLCSDETRTLTLNKLTVDRIIVETFTLEVDEDNAVLYIARAFRIEGGDAITVGIVGNLADVE